MDNDHSASSSLPWLWVIEALAKVKEVETSVLTDLVKKAPAITDDVGKDARNILLLRCLEDFQVQQHENRNAPVPNTEIDQLTDDEDIRQMFESMKLPVRKDGSDLNSDIQKKKLSLPKSALERLKDGIREGHPILDSLKKNSRLSANDLSGNKTSLNDEARSNAVTQGVHSGQDISLQGNPALYQSANSNQSLQDRIKRIRVPSWCKRIDPTSKGKLPEHLNDGNSPNDQSDSHLHVAKMAKHADSKKNEASNDDGNSPKDQSDSHLHVAKMAKHAVSKKNEATKDDGNNPDDQSDSQLHVAKKAKHVASQKNEATKDDGNNPEDESDSHLHVAKISKHAVSKENEATKDDGNSPEDESGSHLHIAKEAKHAVSQKNEATKDLLLSAMVSNEKSENLVETVSKTTVVSKVDKLDGLRSKEDSHDDGSGSGKKDFSKEENNDHPIGPSVCSQGDRTKMGRVDDEETEGDSDDFDDEKIYIETEKQKFLKSQCTFSEDSLSTTQTTELINLCINCNRGGKLLICSTGSCTLGIHPSCLGYDAAPSDFYYCPFCSYSNAISEHLEAKKQSSLARKSLIAYMKFEPKRNSKRCDGEGNDDDDDDGYNKQQKEPKESGMDGNPIDEEYQQGGHSNLCRELVVYDEREKEH